MIDKDMQAYHTYRRFLQTLLTICGCWYMPPKSDKKSTYYWSVCVFCSSIIYTIIGLHISYTNRHDLVFIIKYTSIVTGGIAFSLKVGIFTINRGSLINYHRMLNDLFEEELMRTEKIRKIMFASLHKMYMLAYTYTTIITALALSYFMPSYLFIIRNLRHFHLSTNYTLPISRNYGYLWPVPHNFLYHLHLLFETGAVMLVSITTCSVDNIFGFYVYQISSTLNTMTFKLTNSLPTDKFSDLLKTCVAKHQKLLECRNTLERTYRIIIFWHIITNAVFLCSLIYEATLAKFHVATVLTCFTFSLLKLLQTFTYAWYGTVLTNAGEDFRKGIYFSEWPNSSLNRHVRTNVTFMMMQKPMTVKAIFSPVDIVMFTNLVNTTMSYFFLLRSVGE